MREAGSSTLLNKAVIEIINEEPQEIKVTEAGAKNIAGISAKGISLGAGVLQTGEGARSGNSEAIRFAVQFNPAELRISAGGALDSQDSIGDAAGSGRIVRMCQLSPRARVSFKLIFDDTDREKPQVKQQVEGFLAALRKEHTRKISLIWGKLSYSGYLDSIQASYVMFDPKGSPIRAEAQVDILCMDREAGQGNMGQWKRHYENLVNSLRVK